MTSGCFLYNKHTHSIQSSNCTPWHLSKWVENLCPHKNLQILAAVLFIIAKTWKQSRYPSIGEWMSKLWYLYIMEYCSGINKNKLSKHCYDEFPCGCSSSLFFSSLQERWDRGVWLSAGWPPHGVTAWVMGACMTSRELTNGPVRGEALAWGQSKPSRSVCHLWAGDS